MNKLPNPDDSITVERTNFDFPVKTELSYGGGCTDLPPLDFGPPPLGSSPTSTHPGRKKVCHE